LQTVLPGGVFFVNGNVSKALMPWYGDELSPGAYQAYSHFWPAVVYFSYAMVAFASATPS
jgi:hypothetical protein